MKYYQISAGQVMFGCLTVDRSAVVEAMTVKEAVAKFSAKYPESESMTISARECAPEIKNGTAYVSYKDGSKMPYAYIS